MCLAIVLLTTNMGCLVPSLVPKSATTTNANVNLAVKRHGLDGLKLCCNRTVSLCQVVVLWKSLTSRVISQAGSCASMECKHFVWNCEGNPLLANGRCIPYLSAYTRSTN